MPHVIQLKYMLNYSKGLYREEEAIRNNKHRPPGIFQALPVGRVVVMVNTEPSL